MAAGNQVPSSCVRPGTSKSLKSSVWHILLGIMKNESESFTVWHGLFLGEACALLIALVYCV
jgi:hypothetical protein